MPGYELNDIVGATRPVKMTKEKREKRRKEQVQYEKSMLKCPQIGSELLYTCFL